MDVKERVRRAEYAVDPDAVAEAIVRRITVDAKLLQRNPLNGVAVTLEPVAPARRQP